MGVRILIFGMVFILITAGVCVSAIHEEEQCLCGDFSMMQEEAEPLIQNPPNYAMGLLVEHNSQDPWLPEPIELPGSHPSSWDWRDVNGVNWVTSVKDQGGCGSCYVYGATAAMETIYNIGKNDPDIDIDLSEQFVLSCSMGFPYGNKGCCGGYTSKTLNFLKEEGTPSEECFPYEGVDANGRDYNDCPLGTPSHDPVGCDEVCPDWEDEAVKIDEYHTLYSAESIKTAISTYGPVVASFSVYYDFYFHHYGVYEHKWGDRVGSHIIAIIGYDDDKEYWICKNSWGTDWGEDGFFRIRYGECNIDSPGSSAYFKKCSKSFVNLNMEGYQLPLQSFSFFTAPQNYLNGYMIN